MHGAYSLQKFQSYIKDARRKNDGRRACLFHKEHEYSRVEKGEIPVQKHTPRKDTNLSRPTLSVRYGPISRNVLKVKTVLQLQEKKIDKC